MVQRIKFLRYIDSYRLIYRFEWDIIAVPVISSLIYFFIFTVIQIPLWASPFFVFIASFKTLSLYKKLIKEASPGYLYHFFYSIGIINPLIKERKNGKTIYRNPDNIPYGFETEFRN